MKRLICIVCAMALLYCVAYAEEDNLVLEYTGQCPHDIFDFEILLDEHQTLVKQMGWNPEGYSTGICEICEEKFLLHPYEADYSNVFNSSSSCPHHFRKLPAVIEEGWFTVGAVGHQHKTYHMAVCALCQEYIKYYTRPSGGTATPDMIKPHNWTNFGDYSYHDEEDNQHVFVDICADCGMASSADLVCVMYDNGMCMYELKEALEFYGQSW